jgi:plasmid maintenance system antidote protein VapI
MSIPAKWTPASVNEILTEKLFIPLSLTQSTRAEVLGVTRKPLTDAA